MTRRALRRAVPSAVVPFLVLGLHGCADARTNVVDLDPLETAVAYSGEDFYRGLILGSGPVAAEVPLLRDHLNMDRFLRDPDMAAFIGSVQQRLIEGIHAVDGTFFDTFADAMRSGDRLRITRAFEEATAVTVAAVEAMDEVHEARQQLATDPELQREVQALVKTRAPSGLSEVQLDRAADLALASMLGGGGSGDDYFNESVGACLWLAAAAVVVATVVLVVNYAAAAQIAYAVFVVETTDLQEEAVSPLMQEQIVDSVARLFAA